MLELGVSVLGVYAYTRYQLRSQKYRQMCSFFEIIVQKQSHLYTPNLTLYSATPKFCVSSTHASLTNVAVAVLSLVSLLPCLCC